MSFIDLFDIEALLAHYRPRNTDPAQLALVIG